MLNKVLTSLMENLKGRDCCGDTDVHGRTYVIKGCAEVAAVKV